MKYILSFTFLFVLTTGFSQYGFRPFVFQPVGELGATMKTTGSVDVTFTEFFEESKVRWLYGFNLLWLRPRLDTFRVYSTVTGGYEGTQVYPGTQVIDDYIILNASAGFDWAPFDSDKYFPYIGFDFVPGFYHYRDQVSIPGVKNMDQSIFGVLLGYRAKLGFEYQYSGDMAFFFQTSRNGWINLDPQFTAGGLEFGLGVRIYY